MTDDKVQHEVDEIIKEANRTSLFSIIVSGISILLATLEILAL
ncbi:hypothetical protein [Metabacillus sp. cB07]|nr:hypothetical protein [Metabacillus sp. cB07]